MEGGNGKKSDFYAVLGVKKECSVAELRIAYKKLALRWHPDRCSAPGNSKYVEEAKKKFQAIQEAYSVLSDANKRFMYDVGVYDSDDDENGMGDFLSEMAVLMSQNKPSENEKGSFEDLKNLFEEMFESEIDAFSSSSFNDNSCASFFSNYGESSNSSSKRDSSEMSFEKTLNEGSSGFDNNYHGFSLGVGNLKNYREVAARGCLPERQRSRKRRRFSSSNNVH